MAKKTTTPTDDRIARIAFMEKLQALDLDNLEAGLDNMSVEAATLFPMINNRGADGNVGGGQSRNETLLDETIYVTGTEGDDLPGLSLEHQIVITRDGKLVDGRNRTRSVLKRFGLPTIYWGPTDLEPADVEEAFAATLRTKTSGMDLLKQAAGSEDAPAKAWTEADLLFRHLRVVDGDDAAMFDQVLKQNMARRDMTTSQRACVAASVAVNKSRTKRFGMAVNDETIAESFGVGYKTMKRAKALWKTERHLFQAVLAGSMSVAAAEKEAQKRAGNGVASSEPAEKKSAKKAPASGTDGVETVAIVNADGIRRGIENKAVNNDALYDAITEALANRITSKVKADAHRMVQDALAELLDVTLEA